MLLTRNVLTSFTLQKYQQTNNGDNEAVKECRLFICLLIPVTSITSVAVE